VRDTVQKNGRKIEECPQEELLDRATDVLALVVRREGDADGPRSVHGQSRVATTGICPARGRSASGGSQADLKVGLYINTVSSGTR
jgi:hypothetical protein